MNNRLTDKEIIKLCHDVQIGTGGMDYADALTAIALELGSSRWIPVDQQLPSNSRDHLILLGNALVERGYYYNVGSPIDGWYFRGGRITNVSHWMPLPNYPALPEPKTVAPPLPYQEEKETGR